MNKNLISNSNINDIKNLACNLSIDEMRELLLILSSDKRKTIEKIRISLSKKIHNYELEKLRISNLYNYHNKIKDKYNVSTILCIDEVGRGPLAGPVTVAGVILYKNPQILFVNDSKKLSSSLRKNIFEEVKNKNIIFDYQNLNSKTIDKMNILNTTLYAMKKLVFKIEKNFDKKIDLILIDGNKTIPDIDIKQIAVEKGDSKVYGISLASIIAKEIRDDLMNKLDTVYPGYNFKQNKGYGTSEHIESIKRYGPCLIHRNSFIKNFL